MAQILYMVLTIQYPKISINDKSFLVHLHDNLYDDISKFRMLKSIVNIALLRTFNYTNEKIINTLSNFNQTI